MSAEELCSSLLNEIQLTTETQAKLSKFDQLHEILLIRSPQLLASFVPDILQFMLEPSVKIRKFLIQFSSEAFMKDKSLVSYILVCMV